MSNPKTSWTEKIVFQTGMTCSEDRGLLRTILAGFGVFMVAVLPPFEVKALMGGITLIILLVLSGVECWAERHARLRQLECADIIPRGEYHQVVVNEVKYRSLDGKVWYSSGGKTLEWDLTDKLQKIVAVKQVWPEA